jgi:transcriptional regulator with XRE-family HTH domain
MAPADQAHSGSPTLLRRRLAAELRRLRDAAGLNIDEVAAHLCCSTSKVSRVETARVTAMQRDVKDMLDLYGVGGEQREALLALARGARRREDWWLAYRDVPDVRTYISLEKAANSIRVFQPTTIPGLLQVEEYARLTLAHTLPDLDAAHIERLVASRMERGALLKNDDPPELEVVLDEAVLRRLNGAPNLLREQLQRLIDTTRLPNVALRVLPFSAGPHGGPAESFRILSFPEAADPDLVHLEHPTGDLYLGDARKVVRYRKLFELAQANALTSRRSTAFLVELYRNA